MIPSATLRTASCLSALAYTGLILVLPERVRRHLYAVADDITLRVVTVAWNAWDSLLEEGEAA